MSTTDHAHGPHGAHGHDPGGTSCARGGGTHDTPTAAGDATATDGTGTPGALAADPATARPRELLATLRGASSGRRQLIVAFAGSVAQYGGTVAAAAAGGWLAGAAASGRDRGDLTPGLVVLVAAVALAAIGSWLCIQYAHAFAFRHQATTRLRLYDGIERSAPRELQGRRTGDLAATAMGDVETLELFFSHLMPPSVGIAVAAVAGVIGLAVIHPLLGLIGLAGALATALLPIALARRAAAGGSRLREELGALNADAVDGIAGLRELVLFDHVEPFQQRLAARTRRYRDEQLAQGRTVALQAATTELLVAATAIGVLLTTASLAASGRIAQPWSVAAVTLTIGMVATIVETAGLAGQLAPLRASARRVNEIVDQPGHVPDTATSSPGIGSPPPVRFEAVDFAYREGRPVLTGVSFDAAPGETVALVGASGAGKSTCINLLLRFWDPDGGRVTVGGHDLRDLPVADLRRTVTVVPQDVYLFTGTVADNLRLGRPEATDAELEEAARAARAHEFVSALPDGYATEVGERGALLSGGQRQRLAIARALVTGASVLVLDEAASNLDSENERAIQEALHAARDGRTTIVVAHRLSTIRSADRIVVLDGGRVAETGTHDELAAAGGAYARLIAAQHDGHGGIAA